MQMRQSSITCNAPQLLAGRRNIPQAENNTAVTTEERDTLDNIPEQNRQRENNPPQPKPIKTHSTAILINVVLASEKNEKIWRSRPTFQLTKPNRKTRHKLNKNTKKAAIKVASLNIRRNKNTNPSHSNNKWNHVNQLICQEKIAILAIQEAHMSEEKRQETEKLFITRMKIYASANPESSTSKRGVAFVVNKQLVDIRNIMSREIIAG